MRVLDQDFPVLAVHLDTRLGLQVGRALHACPSKGERPGVARVVQNLQHARMLEGLPEDLALAGSTLHPMRKVKSLARKAANGGRSGAHLTEGVEEQAHRVFDLSIRIE